MSADGGAAFPFVRPVVSEESVYASSIVVSDGMALRDYFAAKAMPAAYRDLWDDVRAGRNGSVPEDWRTGVALDAYAMADAMLKAREVGT